LAGFKPITNIGIWHLFWSLCSFSGLAVGKIEETQAVNDI